MDTHRTLGTLALTFLLPTALPAQASPDIFAMRPEARDRFVQESVRNTTAALQQVEARLARLPAHQLRDLRAQVRAQIRECPDTHATFVVIAAVHATSLQFPTVVEPGPDATRDGRLAAVRRALHRLWRICQRLDVPAAVASIDTKTLLADGYTPNALRAPAVAARTGLADGVRLMTTVATRVIALPGATKARIGQRNASLQRATAGLWPLKGVLTPCVREVGAAAGPEPKPGSKPEPVQVRVARDLVAALRRLFLSYC